MFPLEALRTTEFACRSNYGSMAFSNSTIDLNQPKLTAKFLTKFKAFLGSANSLGYSEINC